jgi:hypothetical protein
MTDTVEVHPFPPSAETIEYGRRTLPQRRLSPGAVGGLDGPAGPLGPEHARALILTFGAFADGAAAQRGYRHFTDMQQAMLSADGFIRWISFTDGPHGYGLGMWRTVEEARAFVRGKAHREAIAEQQRSPFEYSQFAGIWTADTIGRRTLYCRACGTRTVAPASTCTRCRRVLDDGFTS